MLSFVSFLSFTHSLQVSRRPSPRPAALPSSALPLAALEVSSLVSQLNTTPRRSSHPSRVSSRPAARAPRPTSLLVSPWVTSPSLCQSSSSPSSSGCPSSCATSTVWPWLLSVCWATWRQVSPSMPTDLSVTTLAVLRRLDSSCLYDSQSDVH